MSDHVTLDPVRPFYRLRWPDGTQFDYGGDPESHAGRVAALAPGDREGFDRFMDYSRRVFEAGYEGLVDAAFLRFADMVRVAPRLAQLRADRSVYGAVSRFVKDERLRQALSFHALADRRQSVRDERDLHVDPLPRAQVGGVLPARRNGRSGERARRALPAAGRRAPAVQPGQRRARRGAGEARRSTW